MMVSSVSSTNSFVTQLKANGLSANKVTIVEKDLAAVEKASAFASGSTTTTISSASVRAALNTKIDADVSSGKLSASDAAAVKKTLDKIDAQSGASTTTSQSTSAARGSSADAPTKAGKAGGGGGGSSAKTEVSETVTVTGSTKTTTITYSDNTTDTTTTTATAADQAEYAKPAVSDATNNVAKTYLSTIEPGSLINQAG